MCVCVYAYECACVCVYVVSVPYQDSWLQVKREVAAHMVEGKEERQIKILQQYYASMDILCLQEVSVTMTQALQRQFGDAYHIVVSPDASAEQNQNSVILMKRITIPTAGDEVSAAIKAALPSGQISPGDLVAAHCRTTTGHTLLIVSFHGDSDGHSAIPMVESVMKVASSLYPDAKVMVGMDANSTLPDTAAKDHKLSWTTLLDALPQHGLTTAFGDRPPPTDYTSFLARSCLQAQLHKAVPFANVKAQACKEPKDVVLFRSCDFERAKCWRDCMGDGSWQDDSVMPSVAFPSDHAIVAAVLLVL